MPQRDAYLFLVRLLITALLLFLCLLAASVSPCFLGASIISSSAFWRYFLIAVIISWLPVATYKDKNESK